MFDDDDDDDNDLDQNCELTVHHHLLTTQLTQKPLTMCIQIQCHDSTTKIAIKQFTHYRTKIKLLK